MKSMEGNRIEENTAEQADPLMVADTAFEDQLHAAICDEAGFVKNLPFVVREAELDYRMKSLQKVIAKLKSCYDIVRTTAPPCYHVF